MEKKYLFGTITYFLCINLLFSSFLSRGQSPASKKFSILPATQTTNRQNPHKKLILPLKTQPTSSVFLAFKIPDMAAEKRTRRTSFKFSTCRKCFNIKSALNKHMKIHSDVRAYKCSQCEKCFKRADVLHQHLRVHTDEKPYKCTRCKKCFRQSSHLRDHLRIHSGEKPFKCTQCDKCFRRSWDLKKHLSIHNNERSFKCTQCKKCFRRSSHLQVHLRIHNGEKPYKCTQCDKCSRRSSHLKRHLLIHNNERPFRCTRCKKCFRQSSHLKGHLRIHSKEKPFKYTRCKKCFRKSSHLQDHLRIHSGERPFKCTQCEKCFTRKQTLFYHKKNSLLIHRTNVNHVVRISLMTMLLRDMIARNDLLETRKDSLAGCVMNTATIIVDIFITCINTCKDKWSYKRRPYREPKNNKQQCFTRQCMALENDLWVVVLTRSFYELLFGLSSSMQFCTHL